MGARDEYGLPIECCCVDMCAGVYNGLGVGSICSIVVGGVMVISLYFKNENTIKHKRMEFINNIYDKFNTINCGKMPNKMVVIILCMRGKNIENSFRKWINEKYRLIYI